MNEGTNDDQIDKNGGFFRSYIFEYVCTWPRERERERERAITTRIRKFWVRPQLSESDFFPLSESWSIFGGKFKNI